MNKNKKVGIITFHSAINYGAALQTYSLNRFINQMGYDCEDIDYTSKKIKKSYYIKSLSERKNFKQIVQFFLQDNCRLKTQLKFSEFQKKYIKLSELNFDLKPEDLKDKYDYLICGSDQIWNTNITGNDYNYLLAFDDDAIKISYAASFGKTNLSTNECSIFIELLSRFKAISVRENSGMKIIQSLGLSAVSVVPDPVFLTLRDQWISNFDLRENTSHYVLLFTLHKNEMAERFAKKISKEKHLPIYSLTNDFLGQTYSKKLKEKGPVDFLEYILNADYIVTDSFHASAMSLILNKEIFIAMKDASHSGMNSRIDTLADTYGIRNHIIDENTSLSQRIDYEIVNSLILQQRELGVLFLSEALGRTK